jgi:hypothetical protein
MRRYNLVLRSFNQGCSARVFLDSQDEIYGCQPGTIDDSLGNYSRGALRI